MTEKEKITKYTPEQMNNAVLMAKALASAPKDKEIILIAVTKIFVSGVEVGAQLL